MEAAVPIAAIDIGSNSIRMAIAEVLPDGTVEPFERTARAVRLGQDTFAHGRLARETITAAINILKDYRRILETYRVENLRAVATSAVREASNADAFVDRVYMSTGFDVEVIEPTEESRLSYSAVRRTLEEAPKISTKDALIADVGGGSALLTVLHDGEIIASESYRLGAIRLQEAMDLTREAPERMAELIRHEIAGIISAVAATMPLERVKTFIATGGDARFAASQVGKSMKADGLHSIKKNHFDQLVERFTHLGVEELVREYDQSYAAAETLVPALLVNQELLEMTKAGRIIVSEATMRDGLLLDLTRRVRGVKEESLRSGILHAAETIAEKYRVDLDHACQVSETCLKIFDALREEHGLSDRERLLLQVAGIVHEVGGFVSSRAHHKHSYYLLSNAELFGLTADELEIIALIARYHRRSVPKPSHTEYVTKPRDVRMVVCKLAAILRVADALDRGHAQQVGRIDIEKRPPDELVIYVRGATDLALERRALVKSDLFEDIYGMQVRLEEAPLRGSHAASGKNK